jgi:hypothetical protein
MEPEPRLSWISIQGGFSRTGLGWEIPNSRNPKSETIMANGEVSEAGGPA